MIDEKAKADGIRLSEVRCSGFVLDELGRIQQYIARHGLEYLDPIFIQDVADMIGADVGTMFIPNGPVVMMKLGG